MQMLRKPLCLHAGGALVTLDQVREATTPEATATWLPLPHSQLIDTTRKSLANVGLKIVAEQHALAKEGNRYFGLFGVTSESAEPKDYGWVVGMRNSHDQTFRASLVAGSNVFVCDNLAFNGEVNIGHKHTNRLLDKLPGLVTGAIHKLTDCWFSLDKQIAAYKDFEIKSVEADHLCVQAMDLGIIGCTALPKVLKAWRKPEHEAFEPRTAWSLFNAFTGVLRDGNVAELPRRTERLHGMVDAWTGLVSSKKHS